MRRALIGIMAAGALLVGGVALSGPAAQAQQPPLQILLPPPPLCNVLVSPCPPITPLPPQPPLSADDEARLPRPGNPNPILVFGLIRGSDSSPGIVHYPQPGSNDMNQGYCVVVGYC